MMQKSDHVSNLMPRWSVYKAPGNVPAFVHPEVGAGKYNADTATCNSPPCEVGNSLSMRGWPFGTLSASQRASLFSEHDRVFAFELGFLDTAFGSTTAGPTTSTNRTSNTTSTTPINQTTTNPNATTSTSGTTVALTSLTDDKNETTCVSRTQESVTEILSANGSDVGFARAGSTPIAGPGSQYAGERHFYVKLDADVGKSPRLKFMVYLYHSRKWCEADAVFKLKPYNLVSPTTPAQQRACTEWGGACTDADGWATAADAVVGSSAAAGASDAEAAAAASEAARRRVGQPHLWGATKKTDANYDQTTDEHIAGTLTNFQFRGPHAEGVPWGRQ